MAPSPQDSLPQKASPQKVKAVLHRSAASWQLRVVPGTMGCSLGFVGFVGFVGFIGFTGFTGFIGFIGFIGFRVQAPSLRTGCRALEIEKKGLRGEVPPGSGARLPSGRHA